MSRRKKNAICSPDPVLALVKAVRFETLEIVEPSAYVEQRRLEYVKRAELIADEARARNDPELELKAVAFCVRLTSLWKNRVDVNPNHLGLVKAPDLSNLTTEQLQRINDGDAEAIEAMAKKVTDPNGDLN